jgi:hypothetical protein
VITSVYETTGEMVQLSVAVAVPVLAGKIETLQLIVIGEGQVKTGSVTSWMVIVCVQKFEFPQLSVAVQVRIMLELPGQPPTVVTSE